MVRCASLCCIVLCSASLCFTVLCCGSLCFTVVHCASLQHMQQWNDSYSLPTWRGFLTNNAGCSTVQSRTACCSYLDGNQDDGFFGEPCVPAKLGKDGFGKNNQDEVLVCAPLKWTKVNYPDSYAEFMEVCKHTTAPMISPSGSEPVRH